MTDVKTAEPFIARPNQVAADTAEDINLPFNLSSGFGGVDATQPIFSQAALRTGLFDLTLKPKKLKVRWGEQGSQQAEFDVPGFLELVWISENKNMTVAGETKASFQRNLSNEVTSGVSIGIEGASFGAEFSETFSESHFEETFEKYAAHYEREQIYFVRMKGNAARYLTEEAAQDFEQLDAAELVDKYGTHFMTSATFGGVKVFGSRLDIRDQVDESKIEQAMKISVSGKDPESGATGSANAGNRSSDETVRKLHQKMSVTEGRTLGGQAGLPRRDWIESLYVNPAVIDYGLMPLSELAGAGTKAALQAEINRRLRAQQVVANATILAMMVEVQPYATDQGSQARADLSVGRPRQIPGWFYIGQWGLPQAGGFPPGYRSPVFSNVPGADPANPAIKPATGFLRFWGKSASWGLFRAAAPAGYTAIGDLWECTDDPGRIGYAYFYGCLRNDLVEPTVWTGQVWNDSGSKAQDDGSCWGFDNNDPKMLQSPGGPNLARMFKVNGPSGHHQPGETPQRPNLAHIKFLTDSWL